MTPRLTKIIATLGPETANKKSIKDLVQSGVNLFRLNLSHGDHVALQQWISWIRETEQELNIFVGILFDLQGPKMRVGKFENGFIELRKGERLIFTTEKVAGCKGLAPVQYKRFHEDVVLGNKVFLDDGNICVVVKKINGKRVEVEVEIGGKLSNHKGLNMPDAVIRTGALTPKDNKDLVFGLQVGVDYVALSFVSSAADIHQLRRLIVKAKSEAEIVAKIERKKAIENLEEIIQATDAIMVARGDLGIEIPLTEVPLVQHEILRLGARYEKPVIVATQMLETMIINHRPTRAEVSDIAQAVMGCADGIMLSGETAVGKYPKEAVEVMDKTAKTQEKYQRDHKKILPWDNFIHDDPPSISDGISYTANNLVVLLKAQAVLIFTNTGSTASNVAGPRPMVPIIAYTSSLDRARKMSLLRGVIPNLVSDEHQFLNNLKDVFRALKKKKILFSGQRVVITTGNPPGVAKGTNMIWVEEVP